MIILTLFLMWKPGWHSTSTHWNLVVPSVHFDSWYLYFTVCSLTMLNLPLVIKMYTVLQPPPGLGNPEIFSFLFLLKPNYGGLEKAMAPRSSTLAWKIPWIEEPGRLQSMGLLELDMTERLHFHFSLSRIGEGNGNPFQCSCLENPRDGGAR